MAEVVRIFKVALKVGRNKIAISKLPSTINTQSVRISGLNSHGSEDRAFLSDVVCSLPEESDNESNAAIHTLEAQKSILKHEKRVLDTQADILEKYANSFNGGRASPDVMNVFLASFVEHGKSNIRAIAELEAEIEGIDKKIKKKASAVKGSADTELTVAITADNDMNIELKLIYTVNDTQWSPTYELYAVTGGDGHPSRTVSLHYRASITQSTGEDWTDAALTLSTVATDTMAKQIPILSPIQINVTHLNQPGESNIFESPSMLRPALQAGRFSRPNNNTIGFGFQASLSPPPPLSVSSVAPASVSLFHASAQAPSPVAEFGAFYAMLSEPFQPTALHQTVFEIDLLNDAEVPNDEFPEKLVTKTPIALTYNVCGKSSIPSDGKEHIVTVAVLSFETNVEYISVPRIDPRFYLQCEVKNNSEYNLLSGPVSIILDDSYVSETTIPDVGHSDVFNFTLGDDPSIVISYSRASKITKEGEGSLTDTVNITTYTTSITVQNKHAFSIEKLILRDALPISNDSRVRVVLRHPKELVETREGVYVKVEKPKKAMESEVGGTTADGGEDEGLKIKWLKEKEGLYEYKWRIDPNDKIRLQTVFETKASSDLICNFSEYNFW